MCIRDSRPADHRHVPLRVDEDGSSLEDAVVSRAVVREGPGLSESMRKLEGARVHSRIPTTIWDAARGRRARSRSRRVAGAQSPADETAPANVNRSRNEAGNPERPAVDCD